MVPATKEHAIEMAGKLRRADVEELKAVGKHNATKALIDSLDISVSAWTGIYDGKPAFIFGVADCPNHEKVGIPWMMGTPALDKCAKEFIKINPKYINYMRKRYNILINFVDVRNKRAIRWLEWLGFEMSDPKPYGVNNMPFMQFYMKGL